MKPPTLQYAHVCESCKHQSIQHRYGGWDYYCEKFKYYLPRSEAKGKVCDDWEAAE